MTLLRPLFGPAKADIWSQLAAQAGDRFTSVGFSGKNCLTATVDQWTLTLDTYTVSNGTTHNYTRLRAPYVNADGFRFALYRAKLFTPVDRVFGMQNVSIGDREFDQMFVLQSDDDEKARHFFSDEHFRAQLYDQPRFLMQVKDDQGWFGQSFPQNVDELYFVRLGTMKDLAELKSLFDLFAYTLHRLCHVGSAYEKDPAIRL